jgi:N-acetylglucosamine kinase
MHNPTQTALAGQSAIDTPVFCADIGGSFIKFALSRQAGEIEEYDKILMPSHSWKDFVKALQERLTTYRQGLPQDTPLALSCAGLINKQTDTVLASNIPAFNQHHLIAELSMQLQRPVTIANDADCFTLAEAYAGNAVGERNILGVILGTGVGGGLVINGQLIVGRGGITGEWGHGSITKTQITVHKHAYSIPRLACGCGQTGCLDTLGGARGLERLHQLLHQRHVDSHHIISCWQQKQPDALLTVEAWLQLVAEPLSLLVNTLGMDKIVVGGGMASVTPLIQALDEKVRANTLYQYDDPLVVAGKFINQGGLMGASFLGRQHSLSPQSAKN